MQHASSPVAPRAPCDTTVRVICPVTVPVPMCTRAHMCAPDPPYRPLCLHAPTYARAHARTHPTTHPQCTDLRQDSHWQHDGAQGGPVGHGSGKAVLRRVPFAAACLALAVRPGALGFVSRAWWWLGLRHCRHTSGPSICRCLLWHVCVCVMRVCVYGACRMCSSWLRPRHAVRFFRWPRPRSRPRTTSCESRHCLYQRARSMHASCRTLSCCRGRTACQPSRAGGSRLLGMSFANILTTPVSLWRLWCTVYCTRALRQRLTFAGNVLEDTHSLAHYGVQNNAVLKRARPALSAPAATGSRRTGNQMPPSYEELMGIKAPAKRVSSFV
jgi:hypothetical protein